MRAFYLILLSVFFISGCAQRYYENENYETQVFNVPGIKNPTKKPYEVNGQIYYPLNRVPIGWTQYGIASWYGPNFHGRYTSDGEIYNMFAYTAAHKTLPMNTIVRVTNLRNHKSVVVRINDRGPFVKGRIIDLSYAAAKKIGVDVTGTAPVKLTVIGFKGKNYVSGFKIQVGAFIRKRGAEITAEKYKKLGYNAIVLKQNSFYKVYLVGFKTYQDAKRFMIEHKIGGFIVGD
jgi:rare lipoprotein A